MTNLNMTFWMVVTVSRLVGILAEMANMPKQTVRQWIGSFPADGSKTGMVRSSSEPELDFHANTMMLFFAVM